MCLNKYCLEEDTSTTEKIFKLEVPRLTGGKCVLT